MVYKSLEDIIDVIDESVDIIDIIQVCDRRIGKRRLEEIRDTTEDKRFETFTNFIDSNTDECKLEQDDRTVILGIYNHA